MPTSAFTRRSLLTASLGLGLVTATGCHVIKGGVGDVKDVGGLSKDPAPGRAVTIEWYNQFGAASGRALVRLAAQFEQIQDRIAVKVTYAPQATADVQARLLTALAAEDPPDVGFVIPEGATQLAAHGVMTDLAPYLARDGFGEQDFLAPVWKQMADGPHIWATRLMLDVNFPLYWNKELFKKSDLDPEAGPKTVDDVERMSKKILRRNGNQVTTAGMTPWGFYGYSNSMFTWGFAFGGSFLSEDGQQVTADHPNNVTALEWMADYAKSVGGADRVSVAPPGSNLPPIALGHLGMQPMTTPDLQLVRSAAPKLELGFTDVPYADGMGRPGSATWLGGWGLFIPSKAKQPHAAWEFVKWLTLSPEGTTASFREGSNLPTVKTSPAAALAAKDADSAPYVAALERATNTRPNIPVSTALFSEMEIVVANAVYGGQTAKSALKQASDTANAAWDKFRKENQ
ncbi:MAG TPA: extracellular solute-binding protein [Microlunatus sp.]